jgi:transmembrane sensor
VTVADGRVDVAPLPSAAAHADAHALARTVAPVMLSSGDRVHLDAARPAAVEHGVDLTRALSWTEGRLEFTNAPLREVIPQLDRWFDLDIHLANPTFGDRRLTASFKSESASEMLQVIIASLDLRMHRTGRIVVLSSQP